MEKAQKVVVNKEDITKFLDLITIKGANENRDGIWNITKEKISTSLISPNKVVGIVGELKGTFNFENIEKIGIDNFGLLKKALALSSTPQINFSITKNQIQLVFNKTKINLALRKLEYCKNTLPTDKATEIMDKCIGTIIKLTKENLLTILDYYNIIKPQTIEFELKDKALQIIFKEQNNDITTEIPLDIPEITPIKFKIANFIIDIFTTINDDVILSYQPSSPAVYLHYKKDNIDIKYLIAIIQENE